MHTLGILLFVVLAITGISTIFNIGLTKTGQGGPVAAATVINIGCMVVLFLAAQALLGT